MGGFAGRTEPQIRVTFRVVLDAQAGVELDAHLARIAEVNPVSARALNRRVNLVVLRRANAAAPQRSIAP